MKQVLLMIAVVALVGCVGKTTPSEPVTNAEPKVAVNKSELAGFLRNSKGVGKTFEGWRKAAEQGYAEAQYELGLMYYNGEGMPKDYVQSYVWLNFAAANGDARAKENKDLFFYQIEPEFFPIAQCRDMLPDPGRHGLTTGD